MRRLLFAMALAACGTPPATNNDSSVTTDSSLSDAAAAEVAEDVAADVFVDTALIEDASSPNDSSVSEAGSCASCMNYTRPQDAGVVNNRNATELSGIAASRMFPGVFYVHNDSGDTARFFALQNNGTFLREFTLRGVTAIDFEDIAVGPCPQGSCVYLADVGDNAMARTQYTIYRIPEPSSVTEATPMEVVPEALPFVYPDRAHNCETLLVDPSNGNIVVVTKTDAGPSGVYRFPANPMPGMRSTLERVGMISAMDGSPLFTGGDVHPCAPRVLLRTYDRVWEITGASGNSVGQILTMGTWRMLSAPTEPQGEAIGYVLEGNGYVTVSEGTNRPLNRAQCNP